MFGYHTGNRHRIALGRWWTHERHHHQTHYWDHPPIDGKGHAGITEMKRAVLGHYPDHRFRRTTGIDAHHNLARYGWELVDRAGAVALTGTDIAEFADDGAISRVVGFLGDLPPRD